jgi:hypothetical protein
LALDNRFTASPAAVVKLALEISIGREWAEGLARTVFTALLLGAFLILLRRAERGSEPVTQTLMAANVLLLMLGTLWFQPWYLVWLLALAPLAGERWQPAAVLSSAGALGLYLLFDFGWYWLPDFFNGANGLVLNLAAVTLWLAPPGLWLIAQRVWPAQTPGKELGPIMVL